MNGKTPKFSDNINSQHLRASVPWCIQQAVTICTCNLFTREMVMYMKEDIAEHLSLFAALCTTSCIVPFANSCI